MSTIRVAGALPGGLRRSRYWTFKPSANKQDLVISREGMGEWAHVSLHGRRNWHAYIRGYGELDLGVAPEIRSGVRHALSVVIAPSACTLHSEVPQRVEVVQLRDERPLRCGSLDVFLVDDPAVEVLPGGKAPAWRESLGPDGGSVQMFARAVEMPPIELEVKGSVEQVRAAISEIASGMADGLTVLESNGGPVTILDGRLEMP